MPTLIGDMMNFAVSSDTFHKFNLYAKEVGALSEVDGKKKLIDRMLNNIKGKVNEEKVVAYIKENMKVKECV